MAQIRSEQWREAGNTGRQRSVEIQRTAKVSYSFGKTMATFVVVIGLAPIAVTILFLVSAFFANIWGYNLISAFWALDAAGVIFRTMQTVCVGSLIVFIVILLFLSAKDPVEQK